MSENDSKKLLVFEACPGKQLNAFTWALVNPGTYQTTFTHGEIVKIEVDGIELTKVATQALCESTAGSYCQDFFLSYLFIHLSDGGDPSDFVSPDYVYDIVAFVWHCFVNRQGTNIRGPRGAFLAPSQIMGYTPSGCTYPHYYEPSLKSNSLSELSAGIADHFESAMQTSFGSISIVNSEGKWYGLVDDWYWGNKDARVLIGELGDAYGDLETIFIGKIQSPEVSDEEVSFDLLDTREGSLQSIPPEHYDLATYPAMNADDVGKPIPILFGEKTNITPVCIDTYISPGGRTYKISQTHFGSEVFELESIDAVYHKGIALAELTEYTKDLHNGEFTLLFDPGDGLVTCDAKGIKDEFSFDASPFGGATGNYSENVADHLFFILHVLNEIPVDQIDLTSFYDLQTVRTQAVAFYLDEDTATIDVNRFLQQTSLYHFLPLLDGTFAAKYYRKTVPAGTLELRNYDHAGFKKSRPSDGVFRDVFLKYAKDPTTGEWKQLVHSEGRVKQQHGTKNPFTVETALRDDAEAATVLAFYVSLLKDPQTIIDTSISMVGKDLLPTDKVYVNRDIVADGKSVTVCEDDVYVVLESRRNIEQGRIALKLQLDSQLAIYTQHADTPHADVPHADHSDTIHEDDDHGDDHTDDAHSDHDDHYYTDAHEDDVHVDHTDGVHEDQAHTDHNDGTYTDVHEDVAYDDVPHVDTSHVDHDDTLHTDSHTDVSHIDSEV